MPASHDAGFFCMSHPMNILLPLVTLVLGVLLGALMRPDQRDSAPLPVAAPSPPALAALGEVTGSSFPFARVIRETTGHRIIPLAPKPYHTPLREHLLEAAVKVSRQMSAPDSPAREKGRINEVSALFEEALLREISAHPDFTCTIPKTKEGKTQRSGYPDLRVEHLPSGTVAYLDPKLFEDKSITSSFRTFYYEPSPDRSKVTEDALHLLLGFPHDGETGAWTFARPEFVDLSGLEVTLKTEFSASNRELYSIGERTKEQVSPLGTDDRHAE